MIKDKLAGMSLEEKVGQLFQIGFTGKEVTSLVKEMIEDYHVGGIIYFRRNIESPEQTARLSGGLQEIAENTEPGLPLIISTDQEGGTVTRLRSATHFPGNMTIGAAADEDLSFTAGKSLAGELNYMGINMNLAPVLDVNNNPSNPVIGVRSYGENPELVAGMGTAFIRGMQGEGVICCGKHFPGHGDTATDSHLDLPVVNHSRERLERVEFYPFKEAIKQGIDTIMTAHVYFPAIEPEKNIPATLSYNVLSRLLREELGFEGLIMTDCMEMDAIQKTFGTVEGAVRAVESGADMILISYSPEKQKAAIRAVIKAVREGRISRERIDRSVMRILNLKVRRIEIKKNYLSEPATFSTQEGEEAAYAIARNGVTLVKDDDNLIPIRKSARVMVVDFELARASLVENENRNSNPLVSYLQAEGLQIEYSSFSGEGDSIPELKNFDPVIVCTFDAVHNNDQVKLVKELNLKGIPLIVLALRNPYDLKVLPGISTFMTTYDYSPVNIKIASRIISGRYKPRGKLPVSLDLN